MVSEAHPYKSPESAEDGVREAPNVRSWLWYSVAFGMLVGGLLFGPIGLQTDRLVLGGILGVVMGGLVGYCAFAGTIGCRTVGAILGASSVAILAPGCDASGLYAAPYGAAMGFVVGCLGWQWMLNIVGAAVGLVLGLLFGTMAAMVFCTRWPVAGPSPGLCEIVGMVIGGCVTLFVGLRVQGRRGTDIEPDTSNPEDRDAQSDPRST